jgi:hypothetical protein
MNGMLTLLKTNKAGLKESELNELADGLFDPR